MTFGKWITIPSICAALVLAPASTALAGTHAKHHKAKSPKTTQTKKAAGDARAPVAASATVTKASAMKSAPAKKHAVAMKTTATKKVAAAPTKTAVKHKAKHAVVAKAKQPKPVEPSKSVEAGASDTPMAMK